MREVLVLLGYSAYCATCVVVGCRLLYRWPRTRGAAELAMGISFLATAAMLVRIVLSAMTGSAIISEVARHVLYSACCGGVLVTAWRTFRPREIWARVLGWLILTQLITYILRPYLPVPQEHAELIYHPIYWWDTFGQLAPFIWITIESTRLHTVLRRRWRLGAEPNLLLANRMLLWATGLGTIVAQPLVPELQILTGMALGTDVARPGLSPFWTFLLGMTCATCLWFAFFPPTRYRRWILARPRPEELLPEQEQLGESPSFVWVSDRLEHRTPLNRPQIRGTLRQALKRGGLEADRVTAIEMALVLGKVMPHELKRRGLENSEEVCWDLTAELATADLPETQSFHQSPDQIFRRVFGE